MSFEEVVPIHRFANLAEEVELMDGTVPKNTKVSGAV